MTHLGTLAGTGTLVIAEERLGGCRYHIEVFRPRQLIEARGWLEATRNTLARFMQAREAILELENGGSIQILPTRTDQVRGTADSRVTGPIPGF